MHPDCPRIAPRDVRDLERASRVGKEGGSGDSRLSHGQHLLTDASCAIESQELLIHAMKTRGVFFAGKIDARASLLRNFVRPRSVVVTQSGGPGGSQLTDQFPTQVESNRSDGRSSARQRRPPVPEKARGPARNTNKQNHQAMGYADKVPRSREAYASSAKKAGTSPLNSKEAQL